MNPNQPLPLGHFRWKVLLAYRKEGPTFNTTSITEQIKPIAKVYAAIENTGPLVFLNSEQLDTPYTHICYIRWQPFENLQMFNVVVRKRHMPDKSVITEIFRIRRVQEWIGRTRYIRLDMELESWK